VKTVPVGLRGRPHHHLTDRFAKEKTSGSGTFETCRRALKMSALGNIGSDQPMVKTTRLTRNGSHRGFLSRLTV